jgi:magnesium chelatase subunit D
VRVRHLEAPPRRATVFVVDGSGSQAMHRLAEAKGAVELLLAESYVRREEVGLVLFRNRAAEVVLPLTRSPARARRVLAGLPGGGGTPLASGLLLGLREAEEARRRGAAVSVVVLTDGKANVDLQGRGDREAAQRDALEVAGAIARAGVDLLLLDTSPRGEARTEALALRAGGRRVRLPHATSAAVRNAVRGLGDGPERP